MIKMKLKDKVTQLEKEIESIKRYRDTMWRKLDRIENTADMNRSYMMHLERENIKLKVIKEETGKGHCSRCQQLLKAVDKFKKQTQQNLLPEQEGE